MANKRHSRSFVKVSRKRKRIPVEEFAAKLRLRMTLAERTLWKSLRSAMRSWGVVFESQGVVSCFIADFVCYKNKLVIEVDGSIHNKRGVKRKDAHRTRVLQRLGYRVVRYTNKEVLTKCTEVIKSIRNLVFT